MMSAHTTSASCTSTFAVSASLNLTYPHVPCMQHRSSFAKIHVFNASLRLRCRLIYLDTDLLVTSLDLI